ncbi:MONOOXYGENASE-LIKE [Salix koriyanagi]|uniref:MONOOXYGENASE-LIKE n=1 Tax=Salix koriyanagi TaxID=2511006 RepID=A0A9Q1A5D3_9ROSI|nr:MONOOXYGENASE-LIKE [Salix koriyanagi]
MRETKEPFINIIYDCDPLEQIFFDNVVLIGDAAHPTTPHGVRSTNMSILDAVVLGKCVEKWGAENIPSALEEYQRIRLPVASEQVLHSRRVGRIKQGLALRRSSCLQKKENSDPFPYSYAAQLEKSLPLQLYKANSTTEWPPRPGTTHIKQMNIEMTHPSFHQRQVAWADIIIHKITPNNPESSQKSEEFWASDRAQLQTGEDTDPQTRFAKPTIIPEAKIAYPARRDSGACICEAGTL